MMENGKQAQEEIRPMQSGPGSSKSENKTRRVMQRHANDEAEACLFLKGAPSIAGLSSIRGNRSRYSNIGILLAVSLCNSHGLVFSIAIPVKDALDHITVRRREDSRQQGFLYIQGTNLPALSSFVAHQHPSRFNMFWSSIVGHCFASMASPSTSHPANTCL